MQTHAHSNPSTARAITLSLVLIATNATAVFGADEWPQFRGPDGDGHAPKSSHVPLRWSEQEHVRWKTPIHGRAWSSPVISGNQVWVTTATEDGHQLGAVCLDRDSGKIVRDLNLFQVEKPQFAHKFNSYASPTPAIAGGRLYVSFGSPAIACLDTRTGKVLWERRDFVCNHYRGAGSSPVLHKNLLLLHFDGSDHQFVAAVDTQTGKTVWQSERSIDFRDLGPDGKPRADGDYRKAFATPHVASLNGLPTFISIGANATYGYNPDTGTEYWRIEDRNNHSGGTRPVVVSNLVFIPTGWSSGQILAVHPPSKPGEALDATAEDGPKSGGSLHVVWRSKRNVPKKPSLIASSDRTRLYALDDGGIASCMEITSGRELWRERIGGNFSASPILAGGNLYFLSEEGKTTVIRDQATFEKVAENTLGDGFMASPAVAGNGLYVRSRSALYRIE